ncbi:GNAT family N-acetyltransferase [Enterococcus olivae]
MIDSVDLDIVYAIRLKAMYPGEDVEIVKVPGDEHAHHYGFFDADQCVSVVSVFMEENGCQIRKFATLPDYQNKGFGTQLLNEILKTYSKPFFLNARKAKIGFYERFAFKETENTFIKNGHEYVVMILE